jgi:hypothetical protein
VQFDVIVLFRQFVGTFEFRIQTKPVEAAQKVQAGAQFNRI